MSARRKYTDVDLTAARALRDAGEKWCVIQMTLGPGVMNACYAEKIRKPLHYCTRCSESVHRNRFFCPHCKHPTPTGIRRGSC